MPLCQIVAFTWHRIGRVSKVSMSTGHAFVPPIIDATRARPVVCVPPLPQQKMQRSKRRCKEDAKTQNKMQKKTHRCKGPCRDRTIPQADIGGPKISRRSKRRTQAQFIRNHCCANRLALTHPRAMPLYPIVPFLNRISADPKLVGGLSTEHRLNSPATIVAQIVWHSHIHGPCPCTRSYHSSIGYRRTQN